MKKVGILTHFYKSNNYGGVLQAYALVNCINKSGIIAEQMRYPISPIVFSVKPKKHKVLKYLNPRNYFHFFLNKKNQFIKKTIFRKGFFLRRQSFDRFAKLISQSDIVFNKNNIAESADDYDIFITGSDQVWNMDWFDPNYFLEFVPDNKKKIAYAASMGHSSLTEEQKDYLKKVLPTFTAISVREKDMVDLLQPLTDKKIEWVLDPTLLLDKGDWDEICPERRIKEKYLFCYFLGQDKRIRKLAKRYAKKQNLKIVNLPHLAGIRKSDIGFGDYKLYDVAPDDFVSLIKYSNCIFTNSFHACVFSLMYNKNFFAFNQLKMPSMATRLYSLCELFECQDHFCDVKEKFNMDYIDKIGQVDYNKNFDLLKEMKNKSMEFLNKNLD